MESDGKWPFVLEEGVEYRISIRGYIFDTFATYEGIKQTFAGPEHAFRSTRHIGAPTSFALREEDITYVTRPFDW